MELDFTGRTALFVGGPGALCGALAERLSQRGASVFVDRAADARFEPPVETLVRAALADTGRLDILVINGEAGPGAEDPAALAERLAAVVNPRLERAARALELTLPHMRSRGYGRVLNLVPAAGAFGSATDPAGAALAGALFALAKSLAARHPDGCPCINTLSLLMTGSISAAFFDAVPTLDGSCFDAEDPLAMAIHLCHEACTVTGESFSAGAGRFARIFQATAPGLFQPGLGDEHIGANLAAIMDPDGYIVPRDAPDELVLVAV